MSPKNIRLLNYAIILLALAVIIGRLYRMDWEDLSYTTNGRHYRSIILMLAGVAFAYYQIGKSNRGNIGAS